MRKKILLLLLFWIFLFAVRAQTTFAIQAQTTDAWIRINQLGYTPGGVKVAVLGSKAASGVDGKVASGRGGMDNFFELVDSVSRKIVFTGRVGRSYGSYGPFATTYRLDFSSFHQAGIYFLRVGAVSSPVFAIGSGVYDGAADFCLRYMRQQRSGFNPFLEDSCHTHDGYTLYAPLPDSTHIDVVGGWHDASDYLQYVTTSANATWHLLAACRDFPGSFTDERQANGLKGKNGIADVLDEAKWGLDWLLKMHPKQDWLFNQVGDDRDHKGMRIPKEDTGFYGRGLERPVYFCTGSPQQRGKFMNNTTGIASAAGKFASAFALGSELFSGRDNHYAARLKAGAISAIRIGQDKPGVCQTVSVVSPYIYAEDNWTDDMELAEVACRKYADAGSASVDLAYSYALAEPVTPWLGKDTARHYQWYPFINPGHYELAKVLKGKRRDSVIGFYKEGIERVWRKARSNAFYRAIPFIWCSNNLTVSFAIQCYWYRQLSQDTTYKELEQACFDWIFGCNPWGKSMVYGLPAWGDPPSDPHSAFTHLKNYPIDGGLVDGPVYGSIYNNLIGIHLSHEDKYQAFQSDLAVYHDDYGDYSTNEPTMDGTASLIYLLAAQQAQARGGQRGFTFSHGGIIRGDTAQKKIALVFTGDEFGDGLSSISHTLGKREIPASFFFTGRFYRNPEFQPFIKQLYKAGHYLGPHSNDHPLYNDWNKRDSLLITRDLFASDLWRNLDAMETLGVGMGEVKDGGRYFIPPYEWWNDTVADWAREAGYHLFCFTPGIRTNADYTWPGMDNYRSSEWIMQSLKDFDKQSASGLNGAIILVHAGTDKRRTDKFYNRLDELIGYLQSRGYQFERVDRLLSGAVIAIVGSAGSFPASSR